jgi:hypothetical protein
VAAWSVNPGAAVHLASGLLETTTLNVAGGNVTVAPGAGKTIRAEQLSVTGGGGIDLADNKLIVAGGDVGTFGGSTYTGLTSLIQSAYNFSAWNGPGITTSMPDAGPLIGTTTLAISTADETFYAGGTFGGVPVNSGDVLIMYTYAGDLNLDGLVDAQDYGIIDNWVQFPGTSGYANGDFNYDGVIDASDYGIIDNTIQLQGPPIPVNAASGGLAAATAVPEPAAVSALALFSGAFAIRHRRRS